MLLGRVVATLGVYIECGSNAPAPRVAAASLVPILHHASLRYHEQPFVRRFASPGFWHATLGTLGISEACDTGMRHARERAPVSAGVVQKDLERDLERELQQTYCHLVPARLYEHAARALPRLTCQPLGCVCVCVCSGRVQMRALYNDTTPAHATATRLPRGPRPRPL